MSQDTRPHIIVVSTAFAPFLGGAEVAVQEIIKRLNKYFRFTVITARLDSDLAARDIWYESSVIRVGWGSQFDKLWLIAALPWHIYRVRSSDYVSLVWAVMASYAGAGACLNNMLTGIPYVLTLQEGDNLEQIECRIGLGMVLFRQVFSRSSGIQVIAPFLAEWARKLGAKVEPVVIPNGVAIEQFTIEPDERAAWRVRMRAELNIPANASVILTVSRLVLKNGICYLIDAVIAMPGHHLIIIGDGKLRSELEQRARAAEGRIHFMGERMQDELRPFAAAADIFSRPSISEGQGIVFLEALCMGLPVVATNVGGIPSILTNGVHGLLVEPQNVQQLISACERLVPGSALYVFLQKNGYEHVKQFGWNNLAERIKIWLMQNLKSRQ